MDRFQRAIDRASDLAGLLAAACLSPLTFILAYEVVARYVFGSPTIWAWDMATQLSGAGMMLGVSYVLKNDSHVRLDLVLNRASARLQALLNILAYMFVAFVALLLIWLGFSEAWISTIQRETMSTLWAPPVYFLRWTLPVAGLLLLLQSGAAIAQMSKKFHSARWTA